MSEVIENRVVQMAFDNTKFEKGIKSTLNLLDRLNSAIAGINGIKYNVLSIADQVKAVTFDPVNEQMQIGIGKAMALTAALTGVYNVSNQIYNVITNTFRSMTFDQIYAGYSRYEQMVNSTQTILGSIKDAYKTEEEAMGKVEEIQERLLWMADETSYDAMSMLTTIGKFTSRGIDIDEAATAMEGIANWAATVGVNAQGATVAMEQLAQAMGSPYIKQQDWISISGLNMDSKQIRQMIVDSALAHNTLKKVGNEIVTLDGKMSVTTNDMERSFSKGWFTKDVLMDVLVQFGKANEKVREYQEEMSMTASEAIKDLKEKGILGEEYRLSLEALEMGQVARTYTDAIDSIRTAAATKFSGIFKTIFGDYLEAKVLWTDLSEELYNLFIEPLNVLLEGFQRWASKFDGTKKFWDSWYKAWSSIKDILTKVHEVFFKAFGLEATNDMELWDKLVWKLSDTLMSFTVGFEKLVDNVSEFFTDLKGNEKVWTNLEGFFRTIANVLEVLKTIFDSFFNHLFIPVIGRIAITLQKFSAVGNDLGILSDDIRDIVGDGESFNKVFDKMFEIVDKVVEKVEKLFDTLQKAFDDWNNRYGSGENNAISAYFKTLFSDTDEDKTALEKLVDYVLWALDKLDWAIEHITPLLGNFETVISKVAASLKILYDNGLKPILDTVKGTFKDAFDTIKDILTDEQFSTNVNTTAGKALEMLAAGIFMLINAVTSGGISLFRDFVTVVEEFLLFLRDEIFGGMHIVKVVQELAESLGVLLPILIVLFRITEIFGTFVERVNAFRWDGALGKLLFGDSLTNITDQLYYQALAKTFAAIADGILAIAASLFIISLINPDRLDKSIGVLWAVTGMMVVLIGALEGLEFIIEKLSSRAQGLFSGSKSKLFRVLNILDEGLGGTESFMMTAKMTGIASVLTVITTGFIKISIAMLLLSTIDVPKLWAGFGVLSLLSVLMTAIITWFLGLTTIMDAFERGSPVNRSVQVAQEILSIAVLIALMGKAMLSISKAVSGLTNVISAGHEQDVWIAVGVISSLLTLLMVFFAEIAILTRTTMDESNGVKKIVSPSSAEGFIAIARMISVFAISVGLMIGAIVVLGKVVEGGGDLTALMLSLVGIMGLIIAVVASLMGLAKASESLDPTAIAKISSAMTSLALPILSIGLALKIMSSIDVDSISYYIGSLSTIILALLGIIAASTKVQSPGNVMAVAGAMTLVILAISTMILSLIPVLAVLTKANVDTGQVLLFLGALALILAAFGTIVGIAGSIGSKYIPAVVAAASAIAILSAAILSMGLAFYFVGTGLANAIDKVLKIFTVLDTIDGNKIAKNLSDISSSLPDLFANLGKGLQEFLKNLTSGSSLYKVVLNALRFVFDILTGLKPTIFDFILTYYNSVLDMYLTMLSNPKLAEVVTTFFNLIIDIILDVVEENGERITDVIGKCYMWLGKAIEKYAPSFLMSIKNVLPSAFALIREFFYKVIDLEWDVLERAVQAIVDYTPIFIEQLIEFANNVLIGLITGISYCIPELMDALIKGVITLINGVSDAIEDNQEDLVNAVRRLFAVIGMTIVSIVLGWASPLGLLFNAGQNIIQGLVNGIRSKWNKLINVSGLMGSTIEDTVSQRMEVNSPSKVMERIGTFISEGLANGIAKGKDYVTGSVTTMLSGIKDTVFSRFKEALGIEEGNGLMDTILGLFNLNPEIMPILDLSNIESGIGDINNMFGENLNILDFQDSLNDITKTMNSKQMAGLIGVDGFNMGDISLGNDSVSLANSMDEMNKKMDEYISIQKYNMNKEPVTNVYLEGDAKQLFNVVRKENTTRTRATGYNALAMSNS